MGMEEPHENPLFHIFFGGRQPTAEEKEQMKRDTELASMEAFEFQHAWQRLIEELSLDQLRALKMMFHLAGSSDHQLAWQWEAMVAWEAKKRFGICMTCGVNHDEELRNETASIPAKMPSEQDDPFSIFTISDSDRELMEKYHLDDVYDEKSGAFLYFKCTGIQGMRGECGVTYPSLEDRLMKAPEECSGCHQRMMHG